MIDNPTLKTIRERRSTLVFTSELVSDEDVEAILEAGRWAPSAANSQPWDFVVARDARLRSAIASSLARVTWGWGGFAKVPVMVVVAVDPQRDPEHFVEDGAVAAQNICLAAHSLGLATAWAGVYSSNAADGGGIEDELKELLSLPRTHRIIAVIPIGVAEIDPEGSRHPLARMVHHDRYSPSSELESDDREERQEVH